MAAWRRRSAAAFSSAACFSAAAFSAASLRSASLRWRSSSAALRASASLRCSSSALRAAACLRSSSRFLASASLRSSSRWRCSSSFRASSAFFASASLRSCALRSSSSLRAAAALRSSSSCCFSSSRWRAFLDLLHLGDLALFLDAPQFLFFALALLLCLALLLDPDRRIDRRRRRWRGRGGGTGTGGGGGGGGAGGAGGGGGGGGGIGTGGAGGSGGVGGGGVGSGGGWVSTAIAGHPQFGLGHCCRRLLPADADEQHGKQTDVDQQGEQERQRAATGRFGLPHVAGGLSRRHSGVSLHQNLPVRPVTPGQAIGLRRIFRAAASQLGRGLTISPTRCRSGLLQLIHDPQDRLVAHLAVAADNNGQRRRFRRPSRGWCRSAAPRWRGAPVAGARCGFARSGPGLLDDDLDIRFRTRRWRRPPSAVRSRPSARTVR